MEPLTFHDGRVELYAETDCLAALKLMPDCFVDAVITDPPYHLTSIVKRFGGENAAPAKGNEAFVRTSRGFMGQQWDGGDIAFRPDVWCECLRVLKPGGHLASFSGTRTYHRMACAIEDAGFEIRDQLAWAYGSGFPKSHDVSKGIDKAAGVERAVVGVRTDGRGASPQKLDNRGRGDTGIGHADGSKQTYNETAPATEAAREWQGWGTALKPAWEPICLARKPLSEGTVAANVLRWGTGAINVDACRVEAAGDAVIDDGRRTITDCHKGYQRPGASMFNTGKAAVSNGPANSAGRFPANLVHDGSPEVLAGFPETTSGSHKAGEHQPLGFYANAIARRPESMETAMPELEGSTGSAARFFYCAKASKKDRAGSNHPTVKPISLNAWLVRMLTRPGGLVLDPFAGTGTMAAATFQEGARAILIEREAPYCADIIRRVEALA